MNDSNSRVFTFVLAILAVVGIVLGIAALGSSVSTRNAISEIQSQVDGELGVASQLDSDVRELASKTQTAFNMLGRDVQALKMQMTNLVVKAAPPAKKEAAKGATNESLDPNGTYHKIAAGDTLGRLANQYGTSVGAIETLNPGVDSRRLKLGQKIRVK